MDFVCVVADAGGLRVHVAVRYRNIPCNLFAESFKLFHILSCY
jgi:hypothetical protein